MIKSSLSVLFYEKPGDHIGWHFDHNFYRGRHFTILITIANVGRAADGSSHAELKAQIAGQEIAVRTRPNTLVVFEGARVRHKVTPVDAGEQRLVLSMTYCTDPSSRWWQGCSTLFVVVHIAQGLEASERGGVAILGDGVGLIESQDIVSEAS
jgi:2-oxoglutarate-Fe(II)-dependent oxygenase superfamily protein